MGAEHDHSTTRQRTSKGSFRPRLPPSQLAAWQCAMYAGWELELELELMEREHDAKRGTRRLWPKGGESKSGFQKNVADQSGDY